MVSFVVLRGPNSRGSCVASAGSGRWSAPSGGPGWTLLLVDGMPDQGLGELGCSWHWTVHPKVSRLHAAVTIGEQPVHRAFRGHVAALFEQGRPRSAQRPTRRPSGDDRGEFSAPRIRLSPCSLRCPLGSSWGDLGRGAQDRPRSAAPGCCGRLMGVRGRVRSGRFCGGRGCIRRS